MLSESNQCLRFSTRHWCPQEHGTRDRCARNASQKKKKKKEKKKKFCAYHNAVELTRSLNATHNRETVKASRHDRNLRMYSNMSGGSFLTMHSSD